MKTFGYKHKMYLIIFFGLVYNLYLLYPQEELSDCQARLPIADTMTMSEQLNLKDSAAAEIKKSLNKYQLAH